jgi:hypothetical protein
MARMGHAYEDGAPPTWRLFVDRFVGIFGGSETGKSIMIRGLLQILSKEVPEATIFTQTPDAFPTIPGCFIYKGIKKRPKDPANCMYTKIDEIVERQEAKTEIYKRANDPQVLARLARRCAAGGRVDTKTAARVDLVRRKRAALKRLAEGRSGTPALKEDYETAKLLLAHMQKFIARANIGWLAKRALTPEERFSLGHLDFNHRHVLVFDDVSKDLQKYSKTETFVDKIGFACRHRGLTILAAVHSDKMFDTELKKNMHFAIFTSPPELKAFFRREAMDATDTDKVAAKDISGDPTAFDGFHKIFYDKKRRGASHFIRFEFASPRQFDLDFGSATWKAFGWAISNGDTTHANRYREEFAV